MPDIHFEHDEDNQLTVTIKTQQLHMQSLVESNLDDYKQLLGKRENVALFADGEPWDRMKTQERVTQWIGRWCHDDPFSSFAVTTNDTDKFIGHVVLGHGEKPGHSELAYVFDKAFWRKGYGKESVTAVVQDYAPEVAERGYKVVGKNFMTIEATSRTDNPASVKILEAAGLQKRAVKCKFGHERYDFFAHVDQLRKSQPVAELVKPFSP